MLHRIFQQMLILCVIFAGGFVYSASGGYAFEVFAKAAASKNYINADSYTESVSGAAGIGILLIPQVRIEGRYTLISSQQNYLEIGDPVVVATVSNIKTQTNIFSVGLDIDLLGEKSAITPFIFLGVGYLETLQTYYFTSTSSSDSVFVAKPKKTGFSANVGAGIKIRISKSVVFEIEAYGYGMDVQRPNPLVNLSGNAGIRLFI